MPNAAPVTTIRDHHGLELSYSGLCGNLRVTSGESLPASAFVNELREVPSSDGEHTNWFGESREAVVSPAKSLDDLLAEVSAMAISF